jgi:hypothetical protein
MKNMDTRAIYARSKMAGYYLDQTFKMLHFTPEQRKTFCRDPNQYKYGTPPPHGVPDFARILSDPFNSGIYNALHAAYIELANCRAVLVNRKQDGIFEQAKASTELWMKSLVASCFPKMKVDSIHAKKSVHEYIDVKSSHYFGKSYRINVPLTWIRSVYNRGISTVSDGDKTHLILRASERKLDRLRADDVRAYNCITMTGTGGVPVLHEGWVMCWDNGNRRITALNKDFAKAESLLRRRIKKEVTDALLGLD